jgi:hypothetical protein
LDGFLGGRMPLWAVATPAIAAEVPDRSTTEAISAINPVRELGMDPPRDGLSGVRHLVIRAHALVRW